VNPLSRPKVWDRPPPSSDSNGVRDIYVHDRKTGRTRRVSLKSNGQEVGTYGHQLPSISKDGKWIAFSSIGVFTGNDSGNDFDVLERGPLH
jgi:Tol biopolymer transport system component